MVSEGCGKVPLGQELPEEGLNASSQVWDKAILPPTGRQGANSYRLSIAEKGTGGREAAWGVGSGSELAWTELAHGLQKVWISFS